MRLLIAITLFLSLSAGSLAEENTKVVATIAPLHSIASYLLKGVDTPELIISKQLSPHNFQLKPSQRQAIAEADLVLWVGEMLERPIEKLLKDKKGQVIGLHELEGKINIRNFDESGHDHHDHDDHHGHDHSGMDPHFWLSPSNMVIYADVIAQPMYQIYPDHVEQISTNLKELTGRLSTLQAELKSALSELQDKPYLVFHDAYGYFEDEYQLNNVGALTVNPERGIGAKKLLETKKQIEQTQTQCLFSEPQFENKIVKKISAVSGVNTGQLDPIGVSFDAGSELYIELITGLKNALVDCLS